MTNYEKIQNMSIEELADILDHNGCCYMCAYYLEHCKNRDCKQGLLKYLQQEAEE